MNKIESKRKRFKRCAVCKKDFQDCEHTAKDEVMFKLGVEMFKLGVEMARKEERVNFIAWLDKLRDFNINSISIEDNIHGKIMELKQSLNSPQTNSDKKEFVSPADTPKGEEEK